MEEIVKTNKPYTYTILKNDLAFLKYIYPSLEINSIGNSTLEENIRYIKLGEGSNKIMFNASHHANEWSTSLVIMLFVEKFMNLYSKGEIYKGYDVREIWRKTSIYIVPMVNPDGVNLSIGEFKELNDERYRHIWEPYKDELDKWKANIRGVDLNLNYPARMG